MNENNDLLEQFQFEKYQIGEKLSGSNFADFLAQTFIVSKGNPTHQYAYTDYLISKGANFTEFLDSREKHIIQIPTNQIKPQYIESPSKKEEVDYLIKYSLKYPRKHILIDENSIEDKDPLIGNINSARMHIQLNQVQVNFGSPFTTNSIDTRRYSIISVLKKVNTLQFSESASLEELHLVLQKLDHKTFMKALNSSSNFESF
jgi:hypothetical protein